MPVNFIGVQFWSLPFLSMCVCEAFEQKTVGSMIQFDAAIPVYFVLSPNNPDLTRHVEI